MGKKRGITGVRFTHREILGGTVSKVAPAKIEDDYQFAMCCLAYIPIQNPLICPYGYAYSKEAAVKYFATNDKHPFKDTPLKFEDLIEAKFTKDEKGEIIDPVTSERLTPKHKIVMNRLNGNVYNYQSILQFNKIPNLWQDMITCEPFTEDDLITINDPARKLDLPPTPTISLRKEVHESEAQRNARLLLGTFDIKQPKIAEEDKTWFLTRPGAESFAMASQIAAHPPKQKSVVKLRTSLGEVMLELDSDVTPMGTLNFLGHCLRGSYNKANVAKVDTGKHLEIESSALTDESVWNLPISFERNEFRRGQKYQVYILQKNRNMSRITNTADIGISRDPLSIDHFHIIGAVKSGEGYISTIIDGKIYPNGKPVNPCSIFSAEVVSNPFPATPN